MDINAELGKLPYGQQEPKGLYEPIAYALDAGGKRLRPTLALMASQIWDAPQDEVLPAALALEVFHTFTLLHDDVMDHASTRRGRECVHIKWNTNTAILSGDQMLIEAYRLIQQVPAPAVAETLRLFNDMATEVCEGQQMDVEFETSSPSLNDYMVMIGKKTSALLAYALRIGAYLAHATEEEQMALFRFGMAIGRAFQIQDDFLDCFGTEESLGKAIGGDIRENKKTWLRLTAQNLIAERDPRRAVLDSTDVAAVTALYRSLGVDWRAEEAVRALTKEALEELKLLPDNEAKTTLRTLAQNLVTRQN